MKIEAIELNLSDAPAITLRSLEAKDAACTVAYMKTMYASSPFLAREADEWNLSIADEAAWLQKAEADPKRIILGALHHDQLVGLCDFSPVASMSRMVHRAQCGLSVAPDFQHKGIGTVLMQALLELAAQAGYEQMELEVVSTNAKAVSLYKKLKFTKCGTMQRGMKYKDGSYVDLDLMVRRLVQHGSKSEKSFPLLLLEPDQDAPFRD